MEFRIAAPLAIDFLRRLIRTLPASEPEASKEKQFYLALYLIELAMLDGNVISGCQPSHIAGAALYTVRKYSPTVAAKGAGRPCWTGGLEAGEDFCYRLRVQSDMISCLQVKLCQHQLGEKTLFSPQNQNKTIPLHPSLARQADGEGGGEELPGRRRDAEPGGELLRRRKIGQTYLHRRNFIGGFYGVSDIFLTPCKTTV